MSKALEYARQYHRRIPFTEHLGIKVTDLQDGVAQLALELRPELCNSFGTVRARPAERR